MIDDHAFGAADSDFGTGSRAGYRIDESRVEMLDSTKDLATGNNPYQELLYGDGGGSEVDFLDVADAKPVDAGHAHPAHPAHPAQPAMEHPPLAG